MSVNASRSSVLPDFAEDVCLRRAADGAEITSTAVEVVNIHPNERAWWLTAGTIMFSVQVTDLAEGGTYWLELLTSDTIDSDGLASARFNISRAGSMKFGVDAASLFPSGAKRHLLVRTICEGENPRINFSLFATRVS